MPGPFGRDRPISGAVPSPSPAVPCGDRAVHRPVRSGSGAVVRVAIAEDSLLLRDGVVRLLTSAGMEVPIQCGTADELLVRVAADPPDVVVLDIRLPPTHTDEGMRAALHIREHQPGVAVLVLSQYLELGLAAQLLGESADGAGYLLKDRVSDVDEFVAAVRRVGEGGSAID